MCYLAMQVEWKEEYEQIKKKLLESREAVGLIDDTDALIAERGSNYGSPDVFFAQLAKAKEGITGIPTSASREVGYMLLFKVIRYINNPSHIDSLDDIEGYARIGKMLANNKQDKDMQES